MVAAAKRTYINTTTSAEDVGSAQEQKSRWIRAVEAARLPSISAEFPRESRGRFSHVRVPRNAIKVSSTVQLSLLQRTEMSVALAARTALRTENESPCDTTRGEREKQDGSRVYDRT